LRTSTRLLLLVARVSLRTTLSKISDVCRPNNHLFLWILIR
jgi:hypothetical protein